MTRVSAAIGDSRPRRGRPARARRACGEGTLRTLGAWAPGAAARLGRPPAVRPCSPSPSSICAPSASARWPAAARDLDVFATTLAARLDAALTASPLTAPGEALRDGARRRSRLRPGALSARRRRRRGHRRRSARTAGSRAARRPARRRRALDDSRRQGWRAQGAGRRRATTNSPPCATCAPRLARSPSSRRSTICWGRGAGRR